MTMRRLIPNAYSNLLQINRFGPQDVAFGYQGGSLVGTRFQRRDPENPDWQPPQSYHLIAETGAHGAVPPVSFEMKVHDIDGEFPPFEQGEAEFKQILDTFRPLLYGRRDGEDAHDANDQGLNDSRADFLL